MIRYWPLSEVTNSPLLHHTQTWELMCLYHTGRLSYDVTQAVNSVLGRITPSETPIVIIESVGGLMHRMYTERPAPEDFARLERGGFVATKDACYLVIDPLH